MIKVLSVLLALSYTSTALAECKPVTPIQVGEVTECPGFIFSPAMELKMRTVNEDYKLLQEQQQIYIQQKELYKQQLSDQQQIADKEAQKAELWRHAAEESTKKYMEAEQNRSLRDGAFLVSGILLTVLAGWSIGQAAHH